MTNLLAKYLWESKVASEPYPSGTLPYSPARVRVVYHQDQIHCKDEVHMLKGHQYHSQTRSVPQLES